MTLGCGKIDMKILNLDGLNHNISRSCEEVVECFQFMEVTASLFAFPSFYFPALGNDSCTGIHLPHLDDLDVFHLLGE